MPVPAITRRILPALLVTSALLTTAARAQMPEGGGPWNISSLEGGIGSERPLPASSPVLNAAAPFTFVAWVKPDRIQQGEAALILQGDDACAPCRALVLADGRPALRSGPMQLTAAQPLLAGQWTHLAATYDGTTARLFINGKLSAQQALATTTTPPRLAITPPIPGKPHFAGSLAQALLDETALNPAALFAQRPDFGSVQFREVGVGWPLQRKANIGLTEQQDAWLLPRSNTPPSAPASPPRAIPVKPRPALAPTAPGQWQLNGWKLIPAPDLAQSDGAALSRPGVDTAKWLAARVPGTVLATMVDRGIYPDPYYGLNNLSIPESLARQDYWYRTSFTFPAEASGKSLALRFDGINYAAEVWINGTRMGAMKGAFARGRFTFTPQAGENVVAVKVSPPPHPGIPHEQSVKGGVGENGGQLAIDGPTFVATEGWDWIPGIRDRNTGLWQGVTLEATGPLRLGDPHVITDLPLPRTDSADVTITVPVFNSTSAPLALTVTAKIGEIALTRTLTAAPGETTVTFSPATDPALRLANPRLWWPNGYGDPALYTLTLTAAAEGQPSETRSLRFGVRELSYELALFGSDGRLNRVEVDPTDARPGELPLIDVRHQAIKQTPLGWAQSLTPAGEKSPAVRPVAPSTPLPHLTLRVNGVRIAARGGNWGMDDAMKRFGRAELEPYFRLEREAHMNVIRNWMGTNTEPAFYDLADENGMLILNDFWQSTQDFQIEPQDPQLFLANAADTIARYRNHPSIALWFGRNEGVPYPALNEGLDALVTKLDGTRWYTGSSNMVNLQGSGPYNYRPPEGYFTNLASGFSVETGTPSLSTREAIEASVPAADRWPLGDTMAYHDWHFGGNGDTRTFMETLAALFGPGTDLADFERKAQMMNLETHKAMMEGFVGHLWTKNSGRLFWMTHPSWPSNAWQLYSSDMDTSAAYYGARAGAEPVHIQLNLPDNALMVINTTRADLPALTAKVRVTDLAGRTLLAREQPLTAPANTATPAGQVDLAPLMANGEMVLVALDLVDANGETLSRNFYWRGRDPAATRALNAMPAAAISLTVKSGAAQGADRALALTLANTGKTPALAVKLTVLDKAGARVLPAFFEDNYVSLMPGETRTLTVRVPACAKPATIAIRGWNTPEGAVAIQP
ncbi:LamG-like jellyroll fold domain-containing protein [Novosphingobium sp. PASSN1]|uniref:glycosyl hydrolase 2 galactose-binding domain-containing protein n=1 Tax=Novosphingobium sp. PASSN1 TaxID=2015561 RepID=UPI000BCF2EA1|nr:LamG-like jellyroll fold domain-containing protein [Novosphingobium sp. PASSN1]OYU35428.1 MAG: glycoside hydrolase family 2 [Novosphingobium sp. PASSN1]